MTARKPIHYFQFTVEGYGPFPFDMLRYDMCWPWYGEDAARLEHHRRELRRVVLESSSRSLPSQKRWESFGWRVLGIGNLRVVSDARVAS